MKSTIINSAMKSKVVNDLKLSDIDKWSLFFDSGCDYLDILRQRIKNHNVFRAQFADFQLNLTPSETFRRILASPHFWNWWSSQLWRVCYYYAGSNADDVYTRLMFNSSLIPQHTLKKIFNEQQTKQAKQARFTRIAAIRAQQVC